MSEESSTRDYAPGSSTLVEALKGVNAAAGEALAEIQRELQAQPRDPLQVAIALTRGRLAFLQSLAKQIQVSTASRP